MLREANPTDRKKECRVCRPTLSHSSGFESEGVFSLEARSLYFIPQRTETAKENYGSITTELSRIFDEKLRESRLWPRPVALALTQFFTHKSKLHSSFVTCKGHQIVNSSYQPIKQEKSTDLSPLNPLLSAAIKSMELQWRRTLPLLATPALRHDSPRV